MENRIVTLIRDHGMTIADVSRRAGVSRPTIYALARPGYRPSVDVIVAVAKAIGCAPWDIRPELNG